MREKFVYDAEIGDNTKFVYDAEIGDNTKFVYTPKTEQKAKLAYKELYAIGFGRYSKGLKG